MQEVNFAILAGCKSQELLPKLGLIYNCISKEKPDMKALKRFFKEHDFFEKERFETLLRFLDIDISDTKSIKAGPFLTKISKIIDPEDRKRALFDHLTEKNQMLMKYVIDGLAERLYSTNELYRYVTSYVYPGTYITLVDFRFWMDWLEASEHIKMVGIRWGLSELGKAALESTIKLIDIDDLLEEESGDEDDDDDDDDDIAEDADDASDSDSETEFDEDADSDDAGESETDIPMITEPVAPAAAKTAPVQAAPAQAAPVAMPAPVAYPQTISGPVHETRNIVPIEVAREACITESHVEIVVQPIAPKTDETPLQLIRDAFAEADEEEEETDFGDFDSAPKVRIEQLRLDESVVAENVRAVQVWWRNRPGGKLLTARDYGFSKEDFEKEPAFNLFRLSALALQLLRFQGRLNAGQGGQSFAMFDQMGFFQNLFKSRKGVDTILDELLKGGMGQHAEYFCNLHYLLIIRRALKALKDEGVKEILSKENMSELLGNLWKELGSFQLTYEILWIARELGDMEVISCDDVDAVGVVPFPRVRETAFRLGMIETPYAADFTHLISISRRISKFFGRNDAWEAPLMYFDPRRELNYDSSGLGFFTRDQMGID